MKRHGGNKIINIPSGGDYSGSSAYGISKLVLIGLTVHIATGLGGFNADWLILT